MLEVKQSHAFLAGLTPNSRVLNNPLSKEAMDLLPEFDFPTRKSELWKYTPTQKLKKSNFHWVDSQATGDDIPEIYSNRVDISNGKVLNNATFCKNLNDLSSEELAQVGTIANFHRDIFSLTHQAYFQDILFVHFPANSEKNGLQINIHASGDNALSLPRIYICAEESSSSEIYIHLSGDAVQHWSYSQIEAHVEHHAKLNINMSQCAANDFNLIDVAVNVEHSANFHINTLAVEGNWLRNNLDINIIGEYAHAGLNGLVIPTGKQHVDNHTMVNHCVANCTSSENYKNIVGDAATAVFNGKIMVHHDAQKTNAFQSSSNILLNEGANVYAKPELEIYADDVKCSHGSTTGMLDESSMFYLRSRGIPEPTAKKLLLKAFAAEVLEGIENSSLDAFINEIIDQKIK